MSRLRLACALALGLLGVLPAAAAADTDWKRVSSIGAQPGGGQPLELGRDGEAVIGTWNVMSNGTFVSLETVRLTPTRADEVAGLVTVRPASAANWDFLDATPISGPAGAAQVLFTGQLNTNLGPPSGTNIAPLLPSGDLGPAALQTGRSPDMLAAINTPSGLLWAGNSGSTLYTFKPGLDPAFQITGNLIPGCCGYDPRLGFDTSGRLWLAFYSNSTGAIGEWIGQIDPATGQPVAGTFVKAPLSESSDNNNGHGVGFACAAVCRLAYEETDASLGIASGRVVTWAPGEAAPTVVGGASGGNVDSPSIAYRPDGRLWVAWVEPALDRVVATLGKGAGAALGSGGTIANAGRPPKAVADPFLHGMEVVAVGNDLLLNVNAGAGANLTAQFVNLVLEPGAIDTSGIPNPQVTPKSPGGRIVYPGTVTPVELGPNRCVRVKPVADKPARIWAQIFSGRKNGTPVSTRVSFRFTAPGAKSKCMTLQKRPAGAYKGKFFRIKFEVRTGANPKPAEKNRPPWRTQPRIIIDA